MKPGTVAVRTVLAIAVTFALPGLAAAQTGWGGGRSKVDRALQEAVATSHEKQRVIIRTSRDGDTIKRVLKLHGDVVDDSGDDALITAEVHADDVAALAESQSVLSLSMDAVVTPSDRRLSREDRRGAREAKLAERAAAREAAAAERRARRQSRRAAREARQADRQASREERTVERRADRDARKAARDAEKNGTAGAQTLNDKEAREMGRLVHETLGLSTDAPTGAGVVVAVIDSGIYPLEDFGNRIVASVDCTKADKASCVPIEPGDDYGHGTHVAGLLAGSTVGVAPDALLVAVKVLDGNGEGLTSDVIKALNWITANKVHYGIQVANLSLGHPIYESAVTDPLVIAVQEAVQAGVKVVVAAGNFGMNPETGEVGYAGITSPGNAPNALTVGATTIRKSIAREDDRVADYSSRGPTWYDGFLKPDIVAPGDSLLSFLPPKSTLKSLYMNKGGDPGENFVPLSGTSMAAGVASGVIATLLQAGASNAFGVYDALLTLANGTMPVSPLSVNLVKAILQYTAIPLYDGDGHLYDPLTQGAGEINAGGALAIVDSLDRSVPAPGYWLTGWQSADQFGETTIGDETYTWTQSIFWGDNIVWGSGIVESSQWAWGDNIVWGSSYTFGDNIVWGLGWGDNIVWGSLFGGDNVVWGSNVFLDDTVWGSSFGFDNIVWGSSWGDNIVWGSGWGDNIVWGSGVAWLDNIVWGSNLIGLSWGDNIVWGSSWSDNIVWGSLFSDNVVWGSGEDDETKGKSRGYSYEEDMHEDDGGQSGSSGGTAATSGTVDIVTAPVQALAQ